MGRRRIPAILAALILLGAGSLPAGAADIPPHVDPEAAPVEYDGATLLNRYAKGLDYVLARDAAGIEPLLKQAALAHIPEELRGTAEVFFSSSRESAILIPAIEAALEDAENLLAEALVDDSLEASQKAGQKLSDAYGELEVMEEKAGDTGQWWQVDRAGEGSALDTAYREVENKLLQIRNLLDMMGDVKTSLVEQAEAIIDDDLLSTRLTLSVEPDAAFVGETVEFEGRLTSKGEPLEGRELRVMLEGSPASKVVTGSGGYYRGELELPYEYTPEKSLKVLYLPAGEDLGNYLGSSSPTATIDVLFYQAGLELEMPHEAYPGREFMLQGSFDYGADPAPASRDVYIYWQEETIEKEVEGPDFSRGIEVAGDVSPGRYRLTLYAPPRERYAPVRADTTIEVVTQKPVLEADLPGVVFLPSSHTISGQAYSELGPVADGEVKVTLGEWETTARTLEDGTFEANLDTGMSLMLVGAEQIKVSLAPTEPWHSGANLTGRLMVINPINIAGLALAVLIPSVFGLRSLVRNLRIKKKLRQVARPDAPGAPVGVQTPAPSAAVEKPAAKGAPRTVLLGLYREVLRLVEAATSLAMGSSHTLREFCREAGPGLGPLAPYFQEFTLMIEKILYSPRKPGEAEAEKGRQLKQQMLKGVRDEGN